MNALPATAKYFVCAKCRKLHPTNGVVFLAQGRRVCFTCSGEYASSGYPDRFFRSDPSFRKEDPKRYRTVKG